MSFERACRDEVRTKATPKWFARLSALVLVAGLIAIAYPIIRQLDQIILLIVFSGLFLWLWYEAREFCYQRFLARYLSEPIESDEWITEIEEAYLTTEHKGLRVSLPFNLLTHVYEKDDRVYLDFSRLGRVYIPFGAFDSAQQRSSFTEIVNSKKKEPNQSTTDNSGAAPRRV